MHRARAREVFIGAERMWMIFDKKKKKQESYHADRSVHRPITRTQRLSAIRVRTTLVHQGNDWNTFDSSSRSQADRTTHSAA